MRDRKKLRPQRQRGLTCAEQNDGGADVEPSHDTAGERQDTIRKFESPQPKSGGIVAYKFV